jgi:hypothetical protein
MPEAGPGTTITFLATGDEKTSDEPRLLATYNIPIVRRVIEGRRIAFQQREELLTNIKSRCEEVGPTQVSPIFLAVERGVEYLRGIGSVTDSRYLFFQTDGEETANFQIKKALGQKNISNPKLPVPINNNGVRVVFCGLAETIGQTTDMNNKPRRLTRTREPEGDAHLQQIWSKLFSNPELVTFEPYCSKEGLATISLNDQNN